MRSKSSHYLTRHSKRRHFLASNQAILAAAGLAILSVAAPLSIAGATTTHHSRYATVQTATIHNSSTMANPQQMLRVGPIYPDQPTISPGATRQASQQTSSTASGLASHYVAILHDGQAGISANATYLATTSRRGCSPPPIPPKSSSGTASGSSQTPAARIAALASATTTTGLTTTTTLLPATTTTLAVIPTTTTTLAAVYTAKKNTYDIFTSAGSVYNFGGASFFGSGIHEVRHTRVTSMADTPDGGGYWLATAKANIYNFGDAGFFGSPVHVRHRKPIVSIATTPDGGGYWLAATNGAVYNYGDASFCGSAVHYHLKSPVVAILPTANGQGYWLATANGPVYSFGNALALTDPAPSRLPSPIVSMAGTPDRKGYWLATAKGNIYHTGDARFFNSPIHKHFHRPVASITSTADGRGYWVTTAAGQVFNFGDAPFHSSLVHTRLAKRVKVAGLAIQSVPLPPPPAQPVLTANPLRAGIFGYDISNFQCSTTNTSAVSPHLPPSSPATIIEVAGWLDNADNPCLGAEASWATAAAGSTGTHYSLYLFLNSPSNSSTQQSQSATGPGGTCATLTQPSQQQCIAFNYGYNGAAQAYAYASSQGALSSVWWLDIENANLSSTDYSNFPSSYWSSSTNLNDETIAGAISALRGYGVTVGLYGTSVQYAAIAGSFVPPSPQVPLWIAGVPWTSPPYTEQGLLPPAALASWCTGTASYTIGSTSTSELFAGGTPWILQETPGTEASPYGLDPDYLC